MVLKIAIGITISISSKDRDQDLDLDFVIPSIMYAIEKLLCSEIFDLLLYNHS